MTTILLASSGVLFALNLVLLVVQVIFYRNVSLRVSHVVSEASTVVPKQSKLQKVLNPPLPTGLMRFTADDYNIADIQREKRRRNAVKREPLSEERDW